MKDNKELKKTELTDTISSASAEIAAADDISEEELRTLYLHENEKSKIVKAMDKIGEIFLLDSKKQQ